MIGCFVCSSVHIFVDLYIKFGMACLHCPYCHLQHVIQTVHGCCGNHSKLCSSLSFCIYGNLPALKSILT